MKSRMLAAALAAALPLPLLAQTQQIRPPIAHYWLNVETAGGMGRFMVGRASLRVTNLHPS